MLLLPFIFLCLPYMFAKNKVQPGNNSLPHFFIPTPRIDLASQVVEGLESKKGDDLSPETLSSWNSLAASSWEEQGKMGEMWLSETRC